MLIPMYCSNGVCARNIHTYTPHTQVVDAEEGVGEQSIRIRDHLRIVIPPTATATGFT